MRKQKAMLLINFKTYTQVIGPKALRLAQDLAETAQEFPQVEAGFAPPLMQLAKVAEGVRSRIWAQHLDPTGEGKYTGYLSPAAAKAAGAYGTFLNHSEHPLDKKTIQRTAELARASGLRVLVFADSPPKVREWANLSPNYIAYEPPELVGGNISVTTAKPEIIKEAVAAAGSIPLLVGAGVRGKKDISLALSLGAVGAAVSSAVVTSPDPKKIFAELLSGFKG
ncbi:MAG: triose-phosphate isomerase [Patescibacteria group bacterium]|nr:MAG: triose-phosphate isomerase [Patescibacteria group bacterium]